MSRSEAQTSATLRSRAATRRWAITSASGSGRPPRLPRRGLPPESICAIAEPTASRAASKTSTQPEDRSPTSTPGPPAPPGPPEPPRASPREPRPTASGTVSHGRPFCPSRERWPAVPIVIAVALPPPSTIASARARWLRSRPLRSELAEPASASTSAVRAGAVRTPFQKSAAARPGTLSRPRAITLRGSRPVTPRRRRPSRSGSTPAGTCALTASTMPSWNACADRPTWGRKAATSWARVTCSGSPGSGWRSVGSDEAWSSRARRTAATARRVT